MRLHTLSIYRTLIRASSSQTPTETSASNSTPKQTFSSRLSKLLVRKNEQTAPDAEVLIIAPTVSVTPTSPVAATEPTEQAKPRRPLNPRACFSYDEGDLGWNDDVTLPGDDNEASSEAQASVPAPAPATQPTTPVKPRTPRSIPARHVSHERDVEFSGVESDSSSDDEPSSDAYRPIPAAVWAAAKAKSPPKRDLVPPELAIYMLSDTDDYSSSSDEEYYDTPGTSVASGSNAIPLAKEARWRARAGPAPRKAAVEANANSDDVPAVDESANVSQRGQAGDSDMSAQVSGLKL